MPNPSATPKIQNIGHLLPTDADGYLVNECAWDNIQEPWRSLVDELRQGCMTAAAPALHSIYLRGSVPRGRAIAHVSDVDCIVVLHELPPTELNWVEPLEQWLEQRYPHCDGVEISVIGLADVTDPETKWDVLISTQGLCIHGIDLRSGLPRFKPGIDLVMHALGLEEDIADVQQALRQISPLQSDWEAVVQSQCGWIARRMVRTGFELVMQQEQAYTRDLYPCYERFSHYFPEQQRNMYKALELAIAPSSNRAGLLAFLNTFGAWLVEQVNLTYPSASTPPAVPNA